MITLHSSCCGADDGKKQLEDEQSVGMKRDDRGPHTTK
jgi:hypothetical protein